MNGKFDRFVEIIQDKKIGIMTLALLTVLVKSPEEKKALSVAIQSILLNYI